MLFAFLARQDSSQSFELLLRQLDDMSIETREAAERELSNRARSLSRDELGRLDHIAESTDTELRIRAKRVIQRVEWLRAIPDLAWKEIPRLQYLLLTADGKALAEVLFTLSPRLKTPRILIPLLSGLLDDTRPTGIGFISHLESHEVTVAQVAAEVWAEEIPFFRHRLDRCTIMTWWRANKDKNTSEWSIPDLLEADECARSSAIVRLVKRGGTAYLWQAIAAIKSISCEKLRKATYQIVTGLLFLHFLR